jgi:tetratricopeptide (TPR) repeat protein
MLEGSLRKSGNRVRITGQLIDTTTGAHIWADRFDGALDDIFELQDQIAGSVVGAIEPRLRQSEIERARRKLTESLDAWDFYLRALALRYQYTEESIREAITLLERALGIDPSFAPAAAMIGFCRLHQRAHGLGQVSDAQVAEAVRLARRAIESGNNGPDAFWMGAFTLLVLAGERVTAANVIDRALSLNPNRGGPRLAAAITRARTWSDDRPLQGIPIPAAHFTRHPRHLGRRSAQGRFAGGIAAPQSHPPTGGLTVYCASIVGFKNGPLGPRMGPSRLLGQALRRKRQIPSEDGRVLRTTSTDHSMASWNERRTGGGLANT